MRRRVCVIGLDGACFDVIGPWMERGKLPTLSRLRQEGASGGLQSTLPPVSLPAWPSFLTGKNPGKHGLFSFWRDGPSKAFFDSRHIGTETLADILTAVGRNTVSINVPGTYPARPLQGAMVTCMLTPSHAADYTYPAGLKAELLAEIGDYVIDFDRSKRGDALVENLSHAARQRFRAATYLWDRVDWDLFILVFTETDRLQHRFWDRPEQMVRVFSEIDGYIGQLAARLNTSDTLLVLSDHGFNGISAYFYVNSWLLQNGYLETRLTRRTSGRRPPSFWRRLFPGYKVDIAWERSRAYSYGPTSWGIDVNLTGRTPCGCVPVEEYQPLRDELVRRLSELAGSDRTGKLFSKVLTREQVYSGPFLDSIPDILLVPTSTGYALKRDPSRKRVIEPCREPKACHTPTGLIILHGDSIPSGRRVNANLIDVAPTVLCLLGVPIPDDMDGKVIAEALQPHFLRDHPPAYRPPRPVERCADSRAEDEEVSDRLRQLGYID